MLEVKKGSDFGWPYCYFDNFQNKKILSPEYGGDAKKQGRCEGVNPPAMGFPAHMAPNGLLFYTGAMFPEKYKNGAFIAFHGSWNRAPLNQKGFFVAFVPFKDGKPGGDYEVFADGFAGKAEITSPGQAVHRPCGLAQGPDGAIYVSDDVKGTIWKIVYPTK
jgi:glucose/arabinose dehydrogenase